MEMDDPLAAAASPLVEGERIKVRGFETLQDPMLRTLTLPSPLGRERRSGDAII
jgi:hypothetical protein